MSQDIRLEIARARAKRLKELGHSEGFNVPEKRLSPITPFRRESHLICEIKRQSPSKGKIGTIPSAVEQALLYQSYGAKQISVLTEPDYFGGNLADLIEVKKSCPDLSVLRKDFLLSVEDIEVSYRAGADACLLIASLLGEQQFAQMYDKCLELGIEALVELHSKADVDKVRIREPKLVGINSRDLKTFRMLVLQPFRIRSLIDWDCQVIYESGINSRADALFAKNGGFAGVLVGEAVVRNPLLISDLSELINGTLPQASLNSWTKLGSQYKARRPLVKICGIGTREDFRVATELGADLVGFILAPSPRQTTADFIRSLPPSKSLKVGVLVLKKDEDIPEEVKALLDEGFLDFLQFHGNESPELIENVDYAFKALRIKGVDDIDKIEKYKPRPVLIDPYVQGLAGGTGKSLDPAYVKEAKRRGELWLAGGISPENVFDTLSRWEPELIDLSSGVESTPGIKDQDKLKKLFKEIKRYEDRD